MKDMARANQASSCLIKDASPVVATLKVKEDAE